MISRNFQQIRFKVLYFFIFIVMTILSALPIANADDSTIEKSGTCSKGSKWKLSLSPDDSKIEVDFEAENTVLVEQKWKIVIKDNKKTVFQKTVAAGTSFGDDSNDIDEDEDKEEDEDEDFDEEDDDTIHVFDISTDILNTIGKHIVVARATASKTGEVCAGRLVLL
jgi:phosphopantothenoylcysteine synthetase/decarboxylase